MTTTDTNHEDPLYPTELGQIGELLAWLTEHAHRIPRHRQTHVRTLLERVERMVLDDYRT